MKLLYATAKRANNWELNKKETIVSLSVRNHFVLNSSNYGNVQKSASMMINLQYVREYLEILI